MRTSELHFARLRVEAEEALLRELSRIEADRNAQRAQIDAERRQRDERSHELLGRQRAAREEWQQALALVPPGLSWSGARASLALGLAGSAGTALGLVALLAAFGGWPLALTAAGSGTLASLQGSLAASPGQRLGLTLAAALCALVAGWLRWRHSERSLPAARRASLAAAAGALLPWIAHWPVGTPPLKSAPLIEGALIAAALAGSWVAYQHRLASGERASQWLARAALGVMLIAVVALPPWPLGGVALVLALTGAAAVERVNRGWGDLQRLRDAARCQRRYARCRERYEREASGSPAPASRPGPTTRLNWAAAPASFEQRECEIELTRNRLREEAWQRKTQRLAEIDYAQVLHERFHAW